MMTQEMIYFIDSFTFNNMSELKECIEHYIAKNEIESEFKNRVLKLLDSKDIKDANRTYYFAD